MHSLEKYNFNIVIYFKKNIDDDDDIAYAQGSGVLCEPRCKILHIGHIVVIISRGTSGRGARRLGVHIEVKARCKKKKGVYLFLAKKKNMNPEFCASVRTLAGAFPACVAVHSPSTSASFSNSSSSVFFPCARRRQGTCFVWI
jgi:hypothetical protein